MKKRISLILLLVLLLTACSADKTKTHTKKSKDSEEVFMANYPADFLSLAPLGEEDASTKMVLRNMHEGLYKYKDDGSLDLGVAENIEIETNQDYIIFDVKLKDQVYFHNNKELSSEDVKYSYERLAGLIEGITIDMVEGSGNWPKLLNSDKGPKGKIEIKDDKNLKLYLNGEFGVLSTMHSLADGLLVPSNYSEEEQAKHPVGLGAYEFVEHVNGSHISFKRFEKYYGDKPDIKNVRFNKYGDETTLPLAFHSGELDMLALTNDNYDKIKSEGYYINESLSNDVRVVYMNQRQGKKFENKDLRVALNYAVDKQKLLNSISGGRGAVLDSHLSPFLKEYYNDQVEGFYKYSPEKAREYLKKAGYDSDLQLVMKTVAENQMEQDIAALIIEDLEKVGVKVKNDAIPWNSFYEEVYKGHNFDLALINIVGYPDPSRILSRYHSEAGGNMAGFKNNEYDKILQKARLTSEKEESIELYKKLQMILAEEAIGIFTIDPGVYMALGKGYEGYQNYPFAFIDIASIKRR